MNKKFILGFILGGILFSGVTYAATLLATNITYDNTNSGITSTNVQGAIDELYTKANSNSYDEYTGSTTYTPNGSVQTIPTNNKVLKSNITINPVPSNFVELSSAANVTSNTILSGYKGYNGTGELVTGTLNTNCAKGTYVKAANSNATINFGMVPTSWYVTFYNPNASTSAQQIMLFYDSNIGDTIYLMRMSSRTIEVLGGQVYSFDDQVFTTNFGTTGYSYKQSINMYYFACK